MSQTYKGVPSQLFRVVRATYSDSTFVITQNGNWTNIIHRPSGYLIAPYCSLNNVISLANVDYTKTAVVVPSGSLTKTSYWWYITPALSGIVYALPLLRRYVSAGIITQDQYNIFVIASQYNEQTQIRLVSDPQLVFIPNTDEFAALSDDEIFPYLVNCNSLFFGFNGVEYNVFPFQAYYDTSPSSPPNSSDPNYSTLIVQYKIKHESRRAKFQYFDYGMIPVMFNNDANFPVS